MATQAETTIRLNGNGDLVLSLPDKSGLLHELTLQQGKVEQILRHLLAKQGQLDVGPRVGREAGATWRFLLESGLLATAKKIPTGQSGLGKPLSSQKNSKDLGL